MAKNNLFKICIVDDESFMTQPLRRLIRDMLKEHNLKQYEPITFNNPVLALDAIKKLSKDGQELAIIIADIMMPQMNGLDLLESVKRIFPLAPRIVLTGYSDKDNAIRALNKLDLFYYFEKPWDNDELKRLARQALQQYRQNKMELLFKRYVPQQVIEEYLDSQDDAFFKGKLLEATVLFLDIVDFTKNTERMEAVAVIEFLNRLFPVALEAIKTHGGILDKFTGDGLMALFGVPSSAAGADDDACCAVLAAIDMARQISKLSEADANNPPVRVRIGLNTGEVIVGNIGSKERVNYTAVSDVVNTASRIEDAARHLIGDDSACILMSHITYNKVKGKLQGHAHFKLQEPIVLRGKQETPTLYRLLI